MADWSIADWPTVPLDPRNPTIAADDCELILHPDMSRLCNRSKIGRCKNLNGTRQSIHGCNSYGRNRRGAVLANTLFMTSEDMKKRTKRFAIAIVRFAQTLPKDSITAIMARQLVKSGTSVGANYRSSCRAKSDPDFISKMTTTEEEGDEALFWLEVLVEAEIVSTAEAAWLLDEADQLVRIIVASIKTKRANMAIPQSKSAIRDPPSEIRHPIRNPRSAIRNVSLLPADSD